MSFFFLVSRKIDKFLNIKSFLMDGSNVFVVVVFWYGVIDAVNTENLPYKSLMIVL